MNNEWNRTSYPEPYELVKILTNDGRIHTDMMVRAKYGNLVWRNFDDKAVLGWDAINGQEQTRAAANGTQGDWPHTTQGGGQ